MKKSSRAAVFVGFLVPLGILACININGTTLTGGSMSAGGLMPADYLRMMSARDPMQEFYKLHRQEMTKSADAFSDQEMDAVGAVIAGRKTEGIATLEALEAKEPGHYSIASNLGTAYELNGDNRKALQWISEGIRRNPESHEGTEWLHELILQVKLNLEQEPDWLKNHRVLDLDEAQVTAPDYRLRAAGRSLSLKEIQAALLHQLTERMLFVKPKDPIVADLLYTYGVLEAHTSVVESAIKLMVLSKEYGFSVPALMESQIKKYERAILLGKIPFYAVCTSVVVAFVGGLYYCYRRKLFFLTSEDYRAHQEELKAGKH